MYRSSTVVTTSALQVEIEHEAQVFGQGLIFFDLSKGKPVLRLAFVLFLAPIAIARWREARTAEREKERKRQAARA
jgi:hypothetical protein